MTRLLVAVALGGYAAGCALGAVASRAAWCAVARETRRQTRGWPGATLGG